MKIVLLDGEKITCARDMHNAFREALSFPEWYGNNLDALYDMLTETQEEIGVILVNTEALSEALGDRWVGLLHLLVDMKRARRGFHVSFDPFKEKELE